MFDAKSEQAFNGGIIPGIPPLAIAMIRMPQGEDVESECFCRLIANDPDLSRKMAHFAPFIREKDPPLASSEQLTRKACGFSSFKHLILVTSIYERLSTALHKSQQAHRVFWLKSFWAHAIGVAATAEYLAKMLNFADHDQAFAAGLLHDLGKFLCYFFMPDEYDRVRQELCSANDSVAGMETFLDIGHKHNIGLQDRASKFLATRWNLPDQFTHVIWMNRTPRQESLLAQTKDLYSLVRYADTLCESFIIGSAFWRFNEGEAIPSFTDECCNFELPALCNLLRIDDLKKQVKDRVARYTEILGFASIDSMVPYSRLHPAFETLELKSAQAPRTEAKQAGAPLSCDILGDMADSLSRAGSSDEAASILLRFVSIGLTAKRAICLLYDRHRHIFTGYLMDNFTMKELTIVAEPQQMRRFLANDQLNDIEYLGVIHLLMALRKPTEEDTRSAPSNETIGAGGFAIEILGCNEPSLREVMPIMGGLVIDTIDNEDTWRDGSLDNQNRLNALVQVARSAIERLLLSQVHAEKVRELTEVIAKLDDCRKQLFHAHRLATAGQLAASAAHEINNPLTILSLNIQFMMDLLDEMPEHEALSNHLGQAASQEQRISKIVSDMLNFSRPAQPQLSTFSATTVIDNVVAMLATNPLMKRVKLRNEVDPGLPTIMADPRQIEQVVTNLMINASHAMPQGGTITLTGKTNGEFIEVRITDTGLGIPQDVLDKIFDPFFSTKADNGSGSGLGLAISASLMEQNGGEIMATSTLGEGSTFTLLLPIDENCLARQ